MTFFLLAYEHASPPKRVTRGTNICGVPRNQQAAHTHAAIKHGWMLSMRRGFQRWRVISPLRYAGLGNTCPGGRRLPPARGQRSNAPCRAAHLSAPSGGRNRPIIYCIQPVASLHLEGRNCHRTLPRYLRLRRPSPQHGRLPYRGTFLRWRAPVPYHYALTFLTTYLLAVRCSWFSNCRSAASTPHSSTGLKKENGFAHSLDGWH